CLAENVSPPQLSTLPTWPVTQPPDGAIDIAEESATRARPEPMSPQPACSSSLSTSKPRSRSSRCDLPLSLRPSNGLPSPWITTPPAPPPTAPPHPGTGPTVRNKSPPRTAPPAETQVSPPAQ